MKTQKHSIADDFEKYFRVKLATTEKLRNDVYGIRYRVYCEEFGFENPSEFPNGLESDEYDAQSIHCLVEHISSGQPAGCVRMVPTLEHSPDAPLPLEKYCAHSLDKDFINGLKLDRSTICEISRLAVDARFRRRPGETTTRFGKPDDFTPSEDELRTLPFIAISAYLAATALTEATGRTNAFAMMEPFLPRLLKRSGLHFMRAGADIEYHGKRAAYFLTTSAALGSMRADLHELYDCIHGQLFPEGQPARLELSTFRAYA